MSLHGSLHLPFARYPAGKLILLIKYVGLSNGGELEAAKTSHIPTDNLVCKNTYTYTRTDLSPFPHRIHHNYYYCQPASLILD